MRMQLPAIVALEAPVVGWPNLNADVVRAGGMMRANAIDNSRHIIPCDDARI